MIKMLYPAAIAALFMLPVTLLYAQRSIVVAADGTGQFTTIQEAFNAVPDGNQSPVVIVVKKGIYRERLILQQGKNHVQLKGEDVANTKVVYNNHTGKVMPAGDTINTYTSASFFLLADDFTAQDISFANDAGFTAGQAVAVFAQGDRLAFRNCRFTGFQDVLFCSGINSRQYYQRCYIEGTTDFIFGPATAFFDSCQVHSLKNSHVTAASTPADKQYGFVFRNCVLTGDSSLHNVSLGRPWRPFASVTYLTCHLGAHILPEGWNNWKNPDNERTARFAEYNSRGPGSAKERRVTWARQLTYAEASVITPATVFVNWQPVFPTIITAPEK